MDWGYSQMIVLWFWRNLHAVLHRGCAFYIPTKKKCNRVPFSPHPRQHLLFVDFGCWPFWLVYGVTSLLFCVCISLIISDVEQLFMCFLAIATFGEMPLGLLPIFLMELFGFWYKALRPLHLLEISFLFAEVFLLFCGFCLFIFYGFFCCAEAVKFN